jgi:hypothetical protein
VIADYSTDYPPEAEAVGIAAAQGLVDAGEAEWVGRSSSLGLEPYNDDG